MTALLVGFGGLHGQHAARPAVPLPDPLDAARHAGGGTRDRGRDRGRWTRCTRRRARRGRRCCRSKRADGVRDLGAVVLVALGARTLWSAFRVRLGGEADSEVATPRRAFATSLAATASNPLTIASWAAVFAAASTAGIASNADSAMRSCSASGSGAWPGSGARDRGCCRAEAGRSAAFATLDAAAGARDRRLRRAAGVADAARGLVIRVWLIPFSTNVERVSLALAHKGARGRGGRGGPGRPQ